MKKQIFFCYFLVLGIALHAKNVVQISVPKSGTHLLIKCISSLTGIGSFDAAIKNYPADFYIVTEHKFRNISQKNKFWVTHLFYNKRFEPYLNSKKNAFFFIYRDPRDQIVSFAYYMKRNPKYWTQASSISFDQLIMELITSGKMYKNHPPCKNINNLYQKYIPWLESPHICVLRFEDLVGPKGGGNLEKQCLSIEKIANHLDIFLTEQQILQTADSLFGRKARNFRRGQIGDWKTHFNEEHKIAFKEIAGQLLIDLGYEDDFDW